MSLSVAEKIADAVLYEGYMLYPYRSSSVKNRQRFNWGSLAPKAYSDAQNGTEAWEMQTECLARGGEGSKVQIKIRFLHLTDREIGRIDPPAVEVTDDFELVPSLDVNGRLYQAWQEAVERDVVVPAVALSDVHELTHKFSYPATRDLEPLKDENGAVVGVIIRTQREIAGEVVVRAAECATGIFKVTVLVRNSTPFERAEETTRNEALLSSIVSTHTILQIVNGDFVSLLEPPDELHNLAASCQNMKTYPVLTGVHGDTDCILSSPIILYDYPEIAPESAGDLFDGTEIDEILTLRIMTLTEDEKREMRNIDDRARQILERTEMMPEEQLRKMHGALRGLERAKESYG